MYTGDRQETPKEKKRKDKERKENHLAKKQES